jgi:hypothetical protein
MAHLAFEGGQLHLTCAGKETKRAAGFTDFRGSAGNVFYSVVEYIAQPLSMLVVTSFWCISWGALANTVFGFAR